MISLNAGVTAFLGFFLMFGSVGSVEAGTMELGTAMMIGAVGCVMAIDGALRLDSNSKGDKE